MSATGALERDRPRHAAPGRGADEHPPREGAADEGGALRGRVEVSLTVRTRPP